MQHVENVVLPPTKYICTLHIALRGVVVQSEPITTKVVSSNPVLGEVLSTQHYVIKFVSDLQQVGDSLRVLWVSSTNKTDCHDIAEILLNVALNSTNLNQTIT